VGPPKTVRTTPLGAWQLLQLPMPDLTDTVTALDDALGNRAARELTTRLAETPCWQAQFAVLDDIFLARLPELTAVPAEAQHAWDLLCRSAGTSTVHTLAAETGWSRHRLARQLRHHLGLPPKTVARILQFQQALEVLTSLNPPPLAQLAADCGYYDQAHLTNTFRRFADATPTQFLTARWPSTATDEQYGYTSLQRTS
jgi:AraC-like DNA-binding protein